MTVFTHADEPSSIFQGTTVSIPVLPRTARHPRLLVCVLLAVVFAWSAMAHAATSPFFGPAQDRPAAESPEAAQEPPAASTPGKAPGMSPFLGGAPKTPAAQEAAAPQVIESAGEAVEPWLPVLLWQRTLTWAAGVQKELRSVMASFARDIRENPMGRAFWLFLLAGFAYGVVHALGPGHGKSFVCGYFLSRKGSIMQGLALGTGSMLTHVGSAGLLVVILNLILERAGMADFDSQGALLQRISYGLLMALGALLTFKTLFDLVRGRAHEHAHCQADTRGMTAISLGAGLIPCPGSALILIFSITLGIFWAGLAALFFVALGMALTTSLFAVATILFRRAVEHSICRDGRLARAVYTTLSLCGSLAIMLLGAAFFFA